MQFKVAMTQNIFEHLSGVKLTDKQWQYIENDIFGRLDNFHDELIESVIREAQEQFGQETK